MNGAFDNIVISVLVFLVVFIPYLLVSFFTNKPSVKVDDLMARNVPPLYRFLWGLLSGASENLGQMLAEWQPVKAKKLKNQLVIANILMDVRMVFAAEILLAVLCPIVTVLCALFVTRNTGGLVALALLMAFLGYVYPSMIIASAADERQTKIMRMLPFSIDLISSAMSAGVDFNAAIRYFVSIEKPDEPLAVEFGVMLRQLELGKTRIEALDAMSKRVQHDAFTAFAAAVMHGFEVGSSIVETLRIQAEEMRRVRFNIAERKAARAASSMIFPIAIFIMPAMFLIIGTPVLIKVFASGLGGVMQ